MLNKKKEFNPVNQPKKINVAVSSNSYILNERNCGTSLSGCPRNGIGQSVK
jgi:hypothetical protein